MESQQEKEEEGGSGEESSYVEKSTKPRKRGKPGRKRRAKRTVNNEPLEQDATREDRDLEAHLKKECPSLPVHNFSNRCFAPVVLAVLGLGLKFVPKALRFTREVEEEINRALDGLKRRLDLAFWFEEELETDPFIPPITGKREWSPPEPGGWPQQKQAIAFQIQQVTEEAKRDARHALRLCSQSYSRFDKRIQEILVALTADDGIIIKPADKNLGIVIMNRADYVRMVMLHLDDVSTYRKVTDYKALAKGYYAELQTILTEAGHVDDAVAQALMQIPVEELHAAAFYCLPKIHKWKDRRLTCPGRPIASTIGTHSEAASKYLDKKLRLVVNHFQRTVCTSSQQLILKMEALNKAILSGQPLPADLICFCADISALYPSIPIHFGIERVSLMCQRAEIFPAKELVFLVRLLRWVLTTNVVVFGGEHFLQIKGTAMGTPVAVVYSILVLCSMEDLLVDSMPFYTRFIDDIFALCTRSQAEAFIHAFNSVCPDIQLDGSSITLERSGVFLDMNLFIKDTSTIGYSIYQKPLNIYQYIPPFSSHSRHVFPAFILNEFKRYRLMCSEDGDYNAQVVRFHERLTQRGFSSDQIHEARIAVPSRHELLANLVARSEEKFSSKAVNRQLDKTRPILVVCLPTFHKSWVQRFNVRFNFSLRNLVHLPPALTTLPRYKEQFAEGPVLVAHKNLPSVAKILVKSRIVKQ
jgi:hypothetical protein